MGARPDSMRRLRWVCPAITPSYAFRARSRRPNIASITLMFPIHPGTMVLCAGSSERGIRGPRGDYGLWRARRRLDQGWGVRREGWCVMSAKSDQLKGRAKEATGVLAGDKDLESEGKTDRRTGEAEEKIDHAKDKIDKVIDKTKDALHRK
jgi:uncharacterized protein YjbJ (UPF0337 family)